MSADCLGWAASALVLATFCMQGMVALRTTALASNVAFIAYGASAGIDPVLMLHSVLLPLNAWRLAQGQPRLASACLSALSRIGWRCRALDESGSAQASVRND